MIYQVGALLVVAATLFVVRRKATRRRLPLPPGPPGLPILGNIFNFPSRNHAQVYHQWATQLNTDVVHVNMAGQSLLIIDTFEALTELLERRSGIYSSRPPLSTMMDLAGWGWAFSLMPYGSSWRERRKLMNQSFHSQAAKQYRPQQLEATRALLRAFRTAPDQFREHIHLLAGRVMLTSIYGHDIDSAHHPYITDLEQAQGRFADPKFSGVRAVDFLPFLRRLPKGCPGTGFKQDAEGWASIVTRCLEDPMREARAKIDAGSARHSFVSEQLENIDRSSQAHAPDSPERVKQIAATVMGAAFETTSSTLITFILAMALFPDAQRRAQEELDSVLQGELPSFDDEESLPYLKGLLMELLRWNPSLPTSVPHYVHVEDEYNGYHIPANTMVLMNSWAMLHDDLQYPNPTHFNPARFLGKDGRIDPDVRDPRLVAFGAGRRICPGRHFAESTLWINMASILTIFSISEPVNEAGQVIDPRTVEFTSGLVSAPTPFKCKITPRTCKAARLIDEIVV